MNMITSTVSLNCVQELINQPLNDKRQVDLLSEVNSLKYKVSATQREKDDLEDKLTWLQVSMLSIALKLKNFCIVYCKMSSCYFLIMFIIFCRGKLISCKNN
jgi:hypothetical protein